MGLGLDNALSEITLVLFTTLAPSGVAACLAMGALLLAPGLDGARRTALNKFLAIPVLVALVGLVASATHLGNPGNALYVLSGVGRSPLSNEVFAGVVFFGLIGSYWLYSFSQVRRPALERVWIALFMAAGAVFIGGIALAYDVDTIVTWCNPLVPANLVLNALVGGPLLAAVALAAAGAGPDERAFRVCVAVAGAALVANVAGYLAQGAVTMGLANAVVSAAELAPGYYLALCLFAVLCALGIGVDARMLRRGAVSSPGASGGAALSLAGIFAMRFTFYLLHMTVGVAY